MNKFLTFPKAAKYIGVTVPTLKKLIKLGVIKTFVRGIGESCNTVIINGKTKGETCKRTYFQIRQDDLDTYLNGNNEL